MAVGSVEWSLLVPVVGGRVDLELARARIDRQLLQDGKVLLLVLILIGAAAGERRRADHRYAEDPGQHPHTAYYPAGLMP